MKYNKMCTGCGIC